LLSLFLERKEEEEEEQTEKEKKGRTTTHTNTSNYPSGNLLLCRRVCASERLLLARVHMVMR
jgi:hypothetical protein